MSMTNNSYSIHSDYISRPKPDYFLDTPSQIIHQPHVYKLAEKLATRSSASRIIDIGCGNGGKLIELAKNFPIVGVDLEDTLSLARDSIPSGTFLNEDLEKGLTKIPEELFEEAIVICSDVLEHIVDPIPLSKSLAALSAKANFILLSTPDRLRARGPLDIGPPANAAHVREWTLDEFSRFLKDAGFKNLNFAGHTFNHNLASSKITNLVISGSHTDCEECIKNLHPKKVAAIINVYNEVDILPETIRHLNNENIDIHIFDNWSDDGSYELAYSSFEKGLCKSVTRFPSKKSLNYEWAAQLKNVELFARSLEADWIIHYDADEFRVSPWHKVTLQKAISFVDFLGYNAIDFTLLNFRFIQNEDTLTPYEKYLLSFEFGNRPGHFKQIKAWKNQESQVDLVSSGGHSVSFENRRVFPINFLTKHYPLRSFNQANKKVFTDRFPRIEKEKTERGWHRHYDCFINDSVIKGWNRRDLHGWHEAFFNSEYLVERISGIGIWDL